jgi:hypothetical protein
MTAAHWKAIIAHTGDPNLPIIRWDNPFLLPEKGHSPQWHDDEIGVARCIMSIVNAVHDNTEPSYGALDWAAARLWAYGLQRRSGDRGCEAPAVSHGRSGQRAAAVDRPLQ